MPKSQKLIKIILESYIVKIIEMTNNIKTMYKNKYFKFINKFTVISAIL